MHELLKYALSRAIKGLRVEHDVESGAPFTGERNLSMDIVVRPGALANASSPQNRTKGIHLDVTHADPQAQVNFAERQRNQRWNTSNPNLRGAKASPLRSSGTRVL